MDTGYAGNASSAADAFPGQARVVKSDDTSTGAAPRPFMRHDARKCQLSPN